MTDVFAQPYFSVIIPVYNRSEMIVTTVAAVLAQTFVDFELIIVDDGSTDDTEKAISGLIDRRIRYLKKENGERGAARNYGAREAKGRFINFFDSDDIMLRDHLLTAHNFSFENMPEFFHTGYNTIDEHGIVIGEETNFDYDVAMRLIVTNFLGCDSVFVRRDIALQNPFNEDRKLASSEDWELWLRMISRYPLLSCNTITLSMVNHTGRSLLTISADRIFERDQLLLRYLLDDAPFVARFKKQIPLFTADRYTFFALNFATAGNRRLGALRNLAAAIKASPAVLKRKRFWASLRLALRG